MTDNQEKIDYNKENPTEEKNELVEKITEEEVEQKEEEQIEQKEGVKKEEVMEEPYFLFKFIKWVFIIVSSIILFFYAWITIWYDWLLDIM